MRPRNLVFCGVVAMAMLAGATAPSLAAPPQGGNASATKKAARPWDAKFQGLDVNGDGMITFAEWNGGDDSFEALDWDHDGILSGRELWAGATRPEFPAVAPPAGGEVPSAAFERMDADHDYRVTRREWTGTAAAFTAMDLNRDGALSPFEFGVDR